MEHQNVLCVPLSSLEEGGQQPQPGEEIEATVRGSLVHVDGGNAYFHVDEVNDAKMSPEGESEGSDEEQQEEPDEDDGEANLRQMSEEHDAQQEEQ